MEPKTIITFARWGNYTIFFNAIFQQLDVDVISPAETTSKVVAEGAELSPEMYCFPMKVTLGNIIPALKKGANTVLMVQNVGGSCRQRYYGIIQKRALEKAGYDINFLDFRATPAGIYSTVKKISNKNFFQIINAFVFAFKKLFLIEKLEKLAKYYRPREAQKGVTDKIFTESLVRIDKLKERQKFSKMKKEILNKFSKIKIDKNKKLPKIGLIGEIYTVCDPAINFEIERKLGNEGIEVYREMNLSYHLKKLIFPWKDWVIQKKINPYLKSTVGGHGRDAVYEMLHYIKKDFNGIVHLLPMGCMPEVSVRPILERIHQKSGIPFLSLSLDEQVAEAGINTRLEAFIDVVKNHYLKDTS